MSEEFGPTFITITDDEGQEITLEFIGSVELNGTEYHGYFPTEAEDEEEDEYHSPDHYFREDYFKKLQTTFSKITLLEEECSTENQKFGKVGNSAVKYVYTVESDGTVYKIMQYFSVASGYLYIMTYTAQETLFSEHLEEVQSIVSNFEY